MEPVVASYREFAPSPALREHVRAFFSFTRGDEGPSPRRPLLRNAVFRRGESFCGPLMADANASIVIEQGSRCGASGVWTNGVAPSGHVIGAMTGVGAPTASGHAAMVGVYFHSARASEFMRVPLSELTDRIVPLDELWGADATDLAAQLDGMGESARLDRIESELVQCLREGRRVSTSVKVPELTAWVAASRGRLSVTQLADAAGVSRQRLSRVFHEQVGVSPKLYCRLARFQAALGCARSRERVEWARVADALGYADQSHMIAEFREFSSVTPGEIASRRLFHPFILLRDPRRAVE